MVNREASASPNFREKSRLSRVLDPALRLIQWFESLFPSKVYLGTFYLILTQLLFSSMGLFIKRLSGHFVFIVYYYRMLSIVICNYGVTKSLKIDLYGEDIKQMNFLILRGILGFIASGLYFYGVANLPLSEAVVLFKTSPVFVGILSAKIVGEKYNCFKFSMTLVCIIGVLLILKPSALFEKNGMRDLPSLDFRFVVIILCLVHAFFSALVQLLLKVITGKRMNALAITQYFGFFGAILSPVVCFYGAVSSPTLADVWQLVAVMVFGYFGQIAYLRGVLYTPIIKASMLGYSEVFIMAVFDYVFFSYVPDALTIVGALIIIISCIAVIVKKG